MDDVITALAELRPGAGPAALSSLVGSGGSIPMSERAKMLVRADGSVAGTIGGGCLEAEIVAVAGDVLADGVPRLTDYTMTEKQAGEHGLNCGGTVRIYTEAIGPEAAALYREVAAARVGRRVCALCTVVGGDGRALFDASGVRIGGDLPAPLMDATSAWATSCLEAGEPRLFDGPDGAQVFVEPHAPPPLLFVFGGGHVGGRIASLAHEVGFHTVVIDDRLYFANAERHPTADECIADEIGAVFERIVVDEQSYIVAATRGHQHDEVVVEYAIRTPARYIGMLGSERKKLVLWERIEGRGGSRARLDEVYAPIGLNIGADTPEEIAVSVVSELIDVRRGRRKRWKTKRPAGTPEAVA